jgi:hypothetical protein
MVVDKAAGLHALVRTYTTGTAFNTGVYSVRPPGGSWLPPAIVQSGGFGGGRIAVDSTFRVHVASIGSGAGSDVRYHVSTPGGPWTDTSGDNDIFPSSLDLIIDPANNPQVLVGQFGGSGLLLRRSASGWLRQAVPGVSSNASQAIDGAGRTHLLYSTPTHVLESVTVALDGSLGAVETIPTTGPNTTELTAKMVAVGPDKLVVVFTDSAGVHSATKVGDGAWVVAQISATGRVVCSGKCMAADAAGNLHLLSFDSTLRYLKSDASGQWQSEGVDLGSGTPAVMSLGVDLNGVVHLFTAASSAGTGLTQYRHTYRCPAANGGAVAVPRPTGTGTWQELPSSLRPPQRHDGQGMAYDSVRREMVLFGGRDLGQGSAPPETWTYPDSGIGWVLRAPSTSPNPNAYFNHGMVFDSQRGRLVLMGIGGVWDWDGGAATWTVREVVEPHPPFLTPPFLTYPAVRLAYDSQRSKVVVLAAGACPTSCWTLWDWDPPTGLFTPRAGTGTVPSTLSSIAYDQTSGMLIGLGGGETWEWNPTTDAWNNRTPAGTTTNPSSGEIVYAGAGRFINYDGAVTREWSRTAPTWRTVPLSQVGPPARTNGFLAYHAGRGTVWMFGGKGSANYLSYLSPNQEMPGWVFDTTFEWRGPTAP